MAAAVATVKVSEEAKAALGGLTEASPLDRLHEFCRRGNKPTVMELAAKDKSLLTKKGNLGNTASHWAASTGMEDVLEWVLAQGAPLNAKNDVGDTPLHLAVWKDHLAAVQVLKKRKADKTIANEEGKTAPQMARSQAMRELLPEMDETEIADAIQVVNEDDDDDDDDDAAAAAAAAAPAAKPRPPPPKPAGAGGVPKPPPPKPAAPGAAAGGAAAPAAPKPAIKPPPPPPRRA